jgi:hypothetical protein
MAMKALKLAATLLSTLMLAVVGATSAEATQHLTGVSGFEFYATSTEGRFAGTASGDLSGAWSIVVKHTSLDPCYRLPLGSTCASIEDPANTTGPGGSFSLAETSPARQLVTGTFDNPDQAAAQKVGDPPNAITLTRTGPCKDEAFSIVDNMSNVSTGSQQGGTGRFSATLTHYRRSFFGRCITYAATVQGRVALNF